MLPGLYALQNKACLQKVTLFGREAPKCKFSSATASVDFTAAALEQMHMRQIQQPLCPSLALNLYNRNDGHSKEYFSMIPQGRMVTVPLVQTGKLSAPCAGQKPRCEKTALLGLTIPTAIEAVLVLNALFTVSMRTRHKDVSAKMS